ncbi:MAG TPA: hypothetical protein VK678_01275 [Bradyrhizobium sp.]|nr:hypothetical protein [Bradyrhizobium sp.]
MSEAPDFRGWAARIARQAGQERNAKEAQRLMSIAEYWVKLAEMEDWQRRTPINETSH